MERDIAIIAAMSEVMAIGKDGKLLWHLPNDLRRFRALTMGHTVIMGKNTYHSLAGKFPLHGRECIVVSRSLVASGAGTWAYPTLREAVMNANPRNDIFIIGGERLFEEGLEIATKAYITMVHSFAEGDRHFPYFLDFRPEWAITLNDYHEKDSVHADPYSFMEFERIG